MAEADPLRRIQAAARRSTAPMSVEVQRQQYFEELERDLGRDPSGEWRAEQRGSGWLRRVFSFLLFSVLAFVVILAILLWRDGALDALLSRVFGEAGQTEVTRVAGKGPAIVLPDAPVDEVNAPPNEIEPMLNPAPPPPPPEPPEVEE